MSLLIRYIQFLYFSKNEHSLHSPFVYELYTTVILAKTKPNQQILAIECLRKTLKKNQTIIETIDYGAGSKLKKSNTQTIAQIARNSEKSSKFAQLIYRLLGYMQPQTILDLGTSLGITTLYQAIYNTNCQIITFEGCPETAKIAQENFKKIGVKNIQLIVGNIDNNLSQTIANLKKIDFVFFDANHQYKATMMYFELCLEKSTENSFFVFDDINWSKGMQKAWKEITEHPQVMISIDLFFVGIVFFRKNQPKQHFVLRF